MNENEYVIQITELRDAMLDLKALHENNPMWHFVGGEVFINLMEQALTNPTVNDDSTSQLAELKTMVQKVETMLDGFNKNDSVSA